MSHHYSGPDFANPLALPSVLQWSNFSRAWTDAQLGRSRLNSRDDRFGCHIDLLDLLNGGLCAGPSERARIALDQRLSARYTTLPIQLYLFPLYFGFAHLGLIDNVFALSFVYAAVFSPFAIFLLRTYFLAIPKELEGAAIIDGANRWQVFYNVLLPLVSPGILTVALISGLNIWNEFLRLDQSKVEATHVNPNEKSHVCSYRLPRTRLCRCPRQNHWCLSGAPF